MWKIPKLNICCIIGHNFVYNHASLPNKCICKRCDKKMKFDLKNLEWNDVDSFDVRLGTDEELKNRWIK